MTIQRNRTCQHCNKQFKTSQYTAKFCSTECRTKSRSNKTATNRIEKLPVSDEWLFISRECRRAGTVEILQDVDLEKLFSLYRRRFQCYGFDSDKKVSKYHLCHISPVKGKNNTTGLLHHLNLFIGGSLPNQVQGTNQYEGAGLSISNYALKPRWYVKDTDSDKAILAKVQKYLGSKLTDYAKTNPIRKAQRFSIAERVYKHKDNILPLTDLYKMGTSKLLALESDLNNTLLYSIKLTARRSLVVYIEELERFASLTEGQKKGDYLFVSDALRIVCQWLAYQPAQQGFSSVAASDCRGLFSFNPLTIKKGKEAAKLRDFASFTAFSVLQGATVDRALITNTLNSYLQVVSLKVAEGFTGDGLGQFVCIDYIAEEVAEFKDNVERVKFALERVGMLPAAVEASIIVLDRISADLGSAEYFDYPDHYYQDDGYQYDGHLSYVSTTAHQYDAHQPIIDF